MITKYRTWSWRWRADTEGGKIFGVDVKEQRGYCAEWCLVDFEITLNHGRMRRDAHTGPPTHTHPKRIRPHNQQVVEKSDRRGDREQSQREGALRDPLEVTLVSKPSPQCLEGVGEGHGHPGDAAGSGLLGKPGSR